MSKTEISNETLIALVERATGQKIEARKVSVETEDSPVVGQLCVVRTYSAGVHIGTVIAKNGTNVLLEASVRLWKWTEAFTLSEVATKGVGKQSRISARVPLVELSQAIEIIPASTVAAKTFEPRNA